jgi:hypothetical protein
MIEVSKKAFGISGNKVSTVNFMELLQNPEVHQLHPFIFHVNITQELEVKRHEHLSGLPVLRKLDALR